MAEKMFKVVAQAKVRKHEGQEYNAYWCVGKRWDGLAPTENILTDAQLIELKKEETGGYPIHVISVEEVKVVQTPWVPPPAVKGK